MLIEHQQICELIPHAGGMCLIDAVTQWNEQYILCISHSHQNPHNPLRSRGQLSSVHALEYGAQAMAVHGGLLAKKAAKKPQPGYLVALKDVTLHVSSLQDLLEPLTIRAEQLMASNGNLMYAFNVSAGEQSVASARATVITGPFT